MTVVRPGWLGVSLHGVALPVVALLALSGGGVHAAGAPGRPFFDPEATTLTAGTDGVNLVRFTELGLPPDVLVSIEVALQTSVQTSCTVPESGEVLFSTVTSASASTQETYRADAAGRVSGEQTLTAQVGTVALEGLPCEVRRVRATTATVTDSDNAVSLTLVG